MAQNTDHRSRAAAAARQAVIDWVENRGGSYSGPYAPIYLAVTAALNARDADGACSGCGMYDDEHASNCDRRDEAYAALENIAALGTYTEKERPYSETVARMQGEACRVLRAQKNR